MAFSEVRRTFRCLVSARALGTGALERMRHGAISPTAQRSDSRCQLPRMLASLP